MRHFIALVLLSMLLGSPQLALAEPRYTFTHWDPCPSYFCSEFNGINDAGQIVGRIRTGLGQYDAFRGGIILNPGSDGDRDNSANGVNDAGQVVGTTLFGSFMWSGGAFTRL